MNPRPPRCERGALPVELRPHGIARRSGEQGGHYSRWEEWDKGFFYDLGFPVLQVDQPRRSSHRERRRATTRKRLSADQQGSQRLDRCAHMIRIAFADAVALVEPPGHRAGRQACRLAGQDVVRVVTHHQAPPGRGAALLRPEGLGDVQ